MAYDVKFREKVLEYLGKGRCVREAHEVFGVGTTTIKDWKRLQRDTGKLEKRPLNRSFKKIDPNELKVLIEQHPDSYLREYAECFNCTKNAVMLAMKAQGITRKKNERIP